MAHLLTAKVRTRLEALVAQGVPPITAGLSLGIRQATMERWMRLGMRESAPVKPEYPDRMTELHDGSQCAEGVYYQHELECAKLADAVCKEDGKYVIKLNRFVRKLSLMDPATARFMFQKYSSLMGTTDEDVSAKAKAAPAEDDEDVADRITFSIPENGRMQA